ncbi:YceI family protein [Corynebacterium aquatimens]|uniref:YceI family protein n=1 Tax=Corynebacterium TaxID=1716 RepID=UPI001F18A65B|nr:MULTISPECIES: YceI family protein [Corynebacterium]QYH19754.1 YceI family protein [Corynebacterium aquatimens]UIZ93131.1 YceI family protein [Corynebacterium sp. CNCTC7651]
MSTANAKHPKGRTGLIVGVSVFIVIALAVAFIPLIMMLFNSGVKTEGIDDTALREPTTEIDGTWTVTKRPGANSTSAGFTFNEVLPGERKTTSGSTQGVTGAVVIEAGTLQSGDVTVDMTNLTTDSDVRDNNVRRKIFHTDQYPESTFVITEPADLSALADTGGIGQIELTGDLTIHGETNAITHTFDVVRSGDRLIVAGDIPINRLDYGVETPEFVAATIAEEGEINIRLNLAKD